MGLGWVGRLFRRGPCPNCPANKEAMDAEVQKQLGAALKTMQANVEGSGLWLTTTIQLLWPMMAEAVEKKVMETLPTVLNDVKPRWMEGLKLEKFELGNTAPIVTGVQVDTMSLNDDSHPEVRIEMGIEWVSQTDIKLAVQPLPTAMRRVLPGFLGSALSAMTTVTAGVNELRLRATVLLQLSPLDNELPVIKALQVSLKQMPFVDMDMVLFGGEALLSPMKSFIMGIVLRAALGRLITPDHIHIALQKGLPDLQTPEGVLVVRLLRASDVPDMDVIGHSNTFVDLWVRQRIKHRSLVVHKEANPKWGQTFQMLVHMRKHQVLTLELYDEDDVGSDDYIGTALLDLKDLQPGVEQVLALDVAKLSFACLSADAGKVTDAEEGAAAAGGQPQAPDAQAKAAAGKATGCKLHLAVMYVPSSMAASMQHLVGTPGVLQARCLEVGVPGKPSDLKEEKLRARMSVRRGSPPFVDDGERSAGATPHEGEPEPLTARPTSGVINPQRQKCGKVMEEVNPVPFGHEGIFDITGGPEAVAATVLQVELFEDDDGKVVARFEVPLSDLQSRPIPDTHGVCGGPVSLGGAPEHAGYRLNMDVWWHPLQISNEAAPAPRQAPEGDVAVPNAPPNTPPQNTPSPVKEDE